MDEDDYVEETFISKYIYQNGLTLWRAIYLPFVTVFGLTLVIATVYGATIKIAEGVAYLLTFLPKSVINLDIIEPFFRALFAVLFPLTFAIPLFIGGYLIRTLAHVSINNNDRNTKVMLYSFVVSVFIVGYLFWKLIT